MNLIKYNLCLLMLAGTYGRPSVSQFRVDYTYSTKTNAYYKFHEEKTNWRDAVAKCKSEGAQLFYPTNKAEASEVVNLLDPWPHRDNIWIGVSDLRSNEVYETIDGHPLDEVHNQWDAEWHQPDKSFHCVIMWKFHLELWLKLCTKEYSFICKYTPGSSEKVDIGLTTPNQFEITEISTVPIETTTPAILKTTPLDGLPSVFDFRADYTYSEKTNNYYKLHENDVTWKEAVTTCWSEGAQLFYPEDEVETTEVDALINPWYKHIYVWIGVSNLNTQHVYKTIDGRLLNEVHNESNVIDSNDDNCLLMWNGNLKYQLWVNKCNEKISFMCKYPPGSEQESFEYPTAPDQLETTETSTSVIETTTPIITHLGGDNAPMEAQDDQYRIPVQFGNLVGEELRKFSHDEQHDIMISILEVLRDYEAKTLTRIAEQSLPGNIINREIVEKKKKNIWRRSRG